MVVKGTNAGVGSKNANCNLRLSLFSKSQNLSYIGAFVASHGPVNSAARNAQVAQCLVAALKSRILLGWVGD